jgi:hypothetical protein
MLRAASWLYRQSTASEITATLHGQKVVTDICVVGRLVWRNVDEYLFSAEPDPAAKRLTRAVCQATLFSFEVGNLAIKRAN